MRWVFLPGLLLFTSIISAQTDTLKYYFHKNGNQCPKEYASFIAYGLPDAHGIKITNHNIESGLMTMSGYYSDSALTVKNGFFQYFNAEGLRESIGQYHNNLKEGWWTYWTDLVNNNISDSILYEEGKDISMIHFSYFPNDQLSSRVLNNNRDKIKEFSEWNANGSIVNSGSWKNNTGTQLDFYPGGEVKCIRKYKSGSVTSKKFYRPDGESISEEEIKEQEERALNEFIKLIKTMRPIFSDGKDGLKSWFSRKFRLPSALRDQLYDLQTITIVFSLNEKGKPFNLSVADSDNAELLKLVTEFFKDLPRWNMNGLQQFGPISLTISIR